MIRVGGNFTKSLGEKILYFPIIYQDLINKNRFSRREWTTNSANYAEIGAGGPYIITRDGPGRHEIRPDFAKTDGSGDGNRDP
jgi:hypothetical protein